MVCHPKNIIRMARPHTVTRYRHGDTADIISVIMEADSRSDTFVDQDGVMCLIGRDDYETARNVWGFVKKNLRYKPDRSGLEVVKSPSALFSTKFGDCKSFSICEVAILRALGFRNIRYRFASYAPGDFTHVYVIVRIGGRDVIMDAVHTKFDDEVRFFKKKDIPAAKLAGVSGIGGDISNALGIIGFSIAAFILYNIFSD